MGLIASFIHDVESILVCQFEIPRDGWIMRGSHTVDVELLQYFEILSDGSFIHRMTGFWMLHVAVDPIQFDRLAVQVKDLVADFCLFESNPSCNHLFRFTFPIDQLHHQMIETR